MLVLASVHRLQNKAYGANIARFLEANGRYSPTPRVYQTLASLEEEGLLRSTVPKADGERVRGQPARVYELTLPSRSIIALFAPDAHDMRKA